MATRFIHVLGVHFVGYSEAFCPALSVAGEEAGLGWVVPREQGWVGDGAVVVSAEDSCG